MLARRQLFGPLVAVAMCIPIMSSTGVAAPQSAQPRAVVVAGQGSLLKPDRVIAERIEAAGFDLAVIDDDGDLAAVDLDDVDLLAISSSVVPGKVGDTFTNAAVPILTWEPYLYDDLGLASTSGETPRKRTFVTISEADSVLTAGFESGNVGVYRSARSFSYGVPGPDATTIAHEYRQPSRAVIFAYGAGATLADGTVAAAARMAMFPTYEGSSQLNGNGERLIDGAILHLTGVGLTVANLDSSGNADISVALDVEGYPVVAYRRGPAQDLVVVHCNDARCSGDDESVEVVDAAGSVGVGASMVLDDDGNPVISYLDATGRVVKLAHCNDPNCAGSDESIESVVAASRATTRTSLALDASGHPVFTFFDRIPDPNPFLVVHCNDANCSGSDETIESIAGPRTGFDPTLRLDAAGFPVISYFDGDDFDLEVVHCNDADCAGGDESTEEVDSRGTVGGDSSMVLDQAGNPVISYHDTTRRFIKIAACNDPNCAGGDENIVDLARTKFVAWGTSVVLTADGLPIVAHASGRNPDLLITRCESADCSSTTTVTIDDDGRVGFSPSMTIGPDGGLVVGYSEGNKNFVSTAVKLARAG